MAKKDDMMNAVFFKGAMRSILSKLEWYASDYNSSEIRSIANDMKRAFDNYKF
jgi:hypothetical protein